MWDDVLLLIWEQITETKQKLKNITHYQQHTLIIYGAAPFNVEKLDQPQKCQSNKMYRVLLAFSSINKTEQVKCLSARLMNPLVIMLKSYMTELHNQLTH